MTDTEQDDPILVDPARALRGLRRVRAGAVTGLVAIAATGGALYALQHAQAGRSERLLLFGLSALLLEVAVVGVVVAGLWRRVVAQTRLILRQSADMAAQAADLREQAYRVEEQAVALESANEELVEALRQAEIDRATAEESGRRTAALLGAMTDVVLVLDRDGRYLEVAPTNLRRLIRPAEELLGRRIHDVIEPAVADACVAAIREALDERKTVDLEYQLPIGGELVWFSTRVSVLDAGRALWMARDVTAQRRAAEELQRTAETLRAVVDASPVPIITLDAHRRVDQWNLAAERLFGWRHDEVIGRPLPTVPEDRLADRDAIRDAAEAGQVTMEHETERVHRDGTRIPVAVSLAPLRGSAGTVRGKVVVYADLRERNRLRVLRREQERQFKALVEHSPDGILVHVAGRVRFANCALARLVGTAEPAALIGRDVLAMLGAEGHGIATERLARLERERTPTPLQEYRLIRQDGTPLDVEMASAPVEFEGAPAVYTVVRDVSGRHRLEAQLRQAQKMEAVGQLAGGVAHDFNNLLMVIRTVSELLLGDARLPEDQRADVREIREAADRGAQLTRQLLAFSRQQVIRPAVHDLRTIVAGLGQMLQRLTMGRLRLRTALGDAPCPAAVDSGQIEQVVINLVVNARDAMPDGGTVTIETAPVEQAPGSDRWRHGVGATQPLPPGRWIMLVVRDTGTGMDATTQQRVFEPFFTTKPQGKGTGLGLATVYGIVEQHHGHVGLESAPGQGTTFRIFFPAAEGTPVRAAAQPTPRSVRAVAQHTVLLVDDEPQLRAMLRRYLERHHFRVLDAESGEQAVDVSAAHAGPIDVVVSDLMMPGIGGGEAVRQLREQRPRLRVLFTSGYAPEGPPPSEGEGAPLPDDAVFLQKPFAMPELLERLHALLGG